MRQCQHCLDLSCAPSCNAPAHYKNMPLGCSYRHFNSLNLIFSCAMASSTLPTITVNGLPLPVERQLSAPADLESRPSISTAPNPASSTTTSQPRNSSKRQAFDFTHETHEYNNIVYNYHGYGVLVKAAPTYQVRLIRHRECAHGTNVLGMILGSH